MTEPTRQVAGIDAFALSATAPEMSRYLPTLVVRADVPHGDLYWSRSPVAMQSAASGGAELPCVTSTAAVRDGGDEPDALVQWR